MVPASPPPALPYRGVYGCSSSSRVPSRVRALMLVLFCFFLRCCLLHCVGFPRRRPALRTATPRRVATRAPLVTSSRRCTSPWPRLTGTCPLSCGPRPSSRWVSGRSWFDKFGLVCLGSVCATCASERTRFVWVWSKC